MGADRRLRPFLIGAVVVTAGVVLRGRFVDLLTRTTGTWIGTPPGGTSRGG